MVKFIEIVDPKHKIPTRWCDQCQKYYSGFSNHFKNSRHQQHTNLTYHLQCSQLESNRRTIEYSINNCVKDQGSHKCWLEFREIELKIIKISQKFPRFCTSSV